MEAVISHLLLFILVLFLPRDQGSVIILFFVIKHPRDRVFFEFIIRHGI